MQSVILIYTNTVPNAARILCQTHYPPYRPFPCLLKFRILHEIAYDFLIKGIPSTTIASYNIANNIK